MKFIPSDIQHMLKRLEVFNTEWEKLGHELSKTRIGKYERFLRDFVAMGPEGRGSLVAPQIGEAYLLINEISEFLMISEIILKRPHLCESPRIGRIFSGPKLSRDEAGTGNRPRNTLFELTIAALIENAGLHADISSETDVRTEFKGYAVSIECKRPQLFDKAERSIDKAIYQFQLRANSPPFLNIIAVCIGKCLTSGDNLLSAKTQEAMIAKTLHAGEVFASETLRHWEDKKIVSGMFTRVRFVGDIAQERLFNVDHLTVQARPGLINHAHRAFVGFSSTLEKTIPGRVL